MTTPRGKCPPAVPKRDPDTRLSSTSSSSESSVFSVQVTLAFLSQYPYHKFYFLLWRCPSGCHWYFIWLCNEFSFTQNINDVIALWICFYFSFFFVILMKFCQLAVSNLAYFCLWLIFIQFRGLTHCILVSLSSETCMNAKLICIEFGGKHRKSILCRM